jgi:hypothetical protein
MARITHVARAQQRYKTIPVIDPDTNEPKRTPVMKNGEQKKTKHGKPVFMSVTVADKTQPLPPRTCDFCHKPIEVGTPFKHVTPKSGPYGGTQRNRHEACPTWRVWELSNSWSARIAQATDEFDAGLFENPDEVRDALASVAENIRGLAEESRESATNIEEGFGHPTSQSEEAEQRADDLDGWADEIENTDVPDLPEIETRYFVTNGDGAVSDLFETDGYESEEDAEHALAMHRDDENNEDDGFEIEAIDPESVTEEQLDEWRSEVEDACSIVDESPV